MQCECNNKDAAVWCVWREMYNYAMLSVTDILTTALVKGFSNPKCNREN